jgi:hypothetical protein
VSEAHTVDSAQQWAFAHEAHAFVPYGSPHALVAPVAAGLSWMPTIWRHENVHATAAMITAIAPTRAARARPITTCRHCTIIAKSTDEPIRRRKDRA